MNFICFAGVSGAGKDTGGELLIKNHGFERVAIADPLKAMMMELFQLSADQLWGAGRNTPDPRLGRTPRELYQWFGQACREIDPDVWLRPFCARVETIVRAGGRAVCTDLRLGAELRAARRMGATIWLVERKGAGAPGDLSLDHTEQQAASLSHADVDAVLENNATIKAFHAQIATLLQSARPD